MNSDRRCPLRVELTSEISVRLVQSVGGDHMVVAAARASTSGDEALLYADPALAEENAGLIRYLVRMRHGTPFEHACLTVFVHAPAAVWWEWVRHRVGMTIDCPELSFNLESGRYRKLRPLFWVPALERPMIPAAGSRPARPTFVEASPEVYAASVEEMRSAYQVAWDAYESMLARGVATEVARTVLGFGVYYSGWVTCNPRSLMSFLSLRTRDPRARYPSFPAVEIEVAARACESILSVGWPLTYAAFCELGRVGP